MSSKKIFVVMGVAGSGKSLIGAALARRLKCEFVDGDDFHSPANVKSMASGIPLTDADRAEWLRALAGRIGKSKQAGECLVVACSALKRSYRDILRSAAPDLQLIFLQGKQELIAARMAGRRGHYMPASLLDSQLATLEVPGPGEHAWVVDVGQTPKDITKQLLTRIAT